MRASFRRRAAAFSGLPALFSVFRRSGPLAHVQLSRFRKAGRRPRRQDPRAEEARRRTARRSTSPTRSRGSRSASQRRAARNLPRADALAEGAGRPPSRPAALPRLYRRACSATSRRSPATANFGEDQAIIGGFARFRGEPVAVIGQEKGSDTKSRLKHNFGMARPEGYRKAVRIMELADRFGLPLMTLVDTAGAYPGIGAEERGQAEAIARSTSACLGAQGAVASRSSSAKAARAAPSRSPPPTASTCWSMRSIR